MQTSVEQSSWVLECASRSITGAGIGVDLWVIGTEKGGRGVIVGQSIGQAVSCAWQMHSRLNRAGMSAALQANECGVFACTHIECASAKLLAVPGKCTADKSRLNWAVIMANAQQISIGAD